MSDWTNWYRWDEDANDKQGAFVFNHTEPGHVTTDKPEPLDPSFTQQHGWVSRTWDRRHVTR